MILPTRFFSPPLGNKDSGETTAGGKKEMEERAGEGGERRKIEDEEYGACGLSPSLSHAVFPKLSLSLLCLLPNNYSLH